MIEFIFTWITLWSDWMLQSEGVKINMLYKKKINASIKMFYLMCNMIWRNHWSIIFEDEAGKIVIVNDVRYWRMLNVFFNETNNLK